jgi:AcrR family transcriptional regulator
MSDQTRAYRMRRRAESQLETRRRITESAVELHGTLGPSRTSMSAVAARAGVRRSTVYRHFPDEMALFDANPPPDLADWAAIASTGDRLAVALEELYGFYGRAAPMLENLLRDEQLVPIVRERLAAFHGYLTAAAETLMAGRPSRGAPGRRLRAALGHAVELSTWRSLVVEQGLDPAEARRLMCAFVQACDTGPAVRNAP